MGENKACGHRENKACGHFWSRGSELQSFYLGPLCGTEVDKGFFHVWSTQPDAHFIDEKLWPSEEQSPLGPMALVSDRSRLHPVF